VGPVDERKGEVSRRERFPTEWTLYGGDDADSAPQLPSSVDDSSKTRSPDRVRIDTGDWAPGQTLNWEDW
jgi:hypothetical protein